MAEESGRNQDSGSSKSDAKKMPPIIIKRISGGHAGHHGGAWKVAYADFVTAMMAFFLLLWLLNSTPSEKLKGVAQYFEPTVGISGSKGIGFEGGKAQSAAGVSSADREQGVTYGVLRKGEIVSAPQVGTNVTNEEMENERFTMVEGELKKVIASNKDLSQFSSSISFTTSLDGLEIQVADQDKYPMFKSGSADLQIYTKNILTKIVNLIKFSPNMIQIAGYTDADTSMGTKDYTNWELSSDRANAARRFMLDQGINSEQIAKIIGKADSDPIDKANPYSSRNRRITITLLRNSITPYNKVAAPQDLINNPSQEDFSDRQKIIN